MATITIKNQLTLAEHDVLIRTTSPEDIGAVPNTLTINGQQLTGNIVIAPNIDGGTFPII